MYSRCEIASERGHAPFLTQSLSNLKYLYELSGSPAAGHAPLLFCFGAIPCWDYFLPKPPPPGVSIRIRSPASISQLPFDPILRACPLWTIAALPGWPSSPPDNP